MRYETCGPLVPNGCDCFGCCEVPGASTPIWLGSNDAGIGTCAMDTLDDPDKCRPCTITPACFNPCERCELCVGKREIPADCGTTQACPATERPCSRDCQCPQGKYCRTGCCTNVPG